MVYICMTLGRVVGCVQFYGERGWGEIISKTNNYKIKTFEDGILLGLRFLPGRSSPPHHHHDFQLLPAAQSGNEIPGARASGRAELEATSQALAGSCQRRAVSEGHCHRQGGHPQHRADPEGQQGKGRAQARSTWRGGGVRLEVTQ